ncbi:hypothetical protein E8F06_15955 [Pseudomonas sp. BN411]|nr:hypothetical protein [Pseudomonas sp. BN411]
MTRVGAAKTILKPIHRLKLSEIGGAGTPPLQEAERNRCRGGRAAWMPREACGAMDGPSRRAPGATMKGGNPGEAGAECRGKRFGSFLWAAFRRLKKGLAWEGETRYIRRTR